MRTVSDGHGDEPWEDPVSVSPADDEGTRVFSREDFTSVPAEPSDGSAHSTREFARDTGDGSAHSTREFRGDESAGPQESTTRAFTRSDTDPSHGEPEPGSGSAFTRRFVRERPLPRTSGQRRSPSPAPSPYTAPVDEYVPLDADLQTSLDQTPPYGTRRPRLEDEAPRGGRPERPRPERPRRKRRRIRLRWVIALLLLAVLAIPPGTWGWVWYTARQDDRTPSDAIIVLGASQYNGVPSPVFEARLRQAQALYLDGVAPVIVTVGGKQPEDNYTEAASGRNWLVEVGVPADSVIAVEEGRDTLQSIQAVSLVFEANGWETAILVSDPWHSLRSKQIAGDYGIDAGASPSRSGPAVIERRTQLWYISRETASLWYYWIFNDSSDIRVNAA